ncbi:MAG: TrkH family potassium uptake protein [Solobacterium sp.]|nr:TrkH family potassium uptake protein [Solobacterium sp.]
MNFKLIWRIIAYILLIEAGLMLPSLGISLARSETAAVNAFINSIVIILFVVAFLLLVTRNYKKGRFYSREGLTTTGLTWIMMSALGCLPFYFSKAIPSYVDAMFEMVSGFTTTGSSILPEVESMAHGLLFWRSFSHWIGGMGVLVFLLAIVSPGGKNEGFTLHILKAESPGPAVGKMVPRMKDTAKILYLIYLGLTVLNTVFLLFGGMTLFEALCTAMRTAGTGGFGIRNDSLASFSPYLQNVTTVFMFLFSVNFSIYYLILLRHFNEAFADEELRLFLVMIVASIGLIAWNVRPLYTTMEETVRHSAFTVGTVMSTTGYATTDFDLWPSFSKAILLFLMMVGACAGSTGGGMKQVRLLLLWRSLKRNLHKSLHPTEVRSVMVNGRAMDEEIITNTNAYLIAYVIIVVGSVLVLSLDGFDFETNFSAVMATFNNIGPGFHAVGPTCNFAAYSTLSKLVMIADMLAGRLEIYPILILISKSTWKKAR